MGRYLPTSLNINDLLTAVGLLSRPSPKDDHYICICNRRFIRHMHPALWWKIKDIRKRVKNTRFRLTWGKIRKCPDPLAEVKYK